MEKTFEKTKFFWLAIFGAMLYGFFSLLFIVPVYKEASFGSIMVEVGFLHGFIFTVLILARKDFFSGILHPAVKSLSWLIVSILCFVAMLLSDNEKENSILFLHFICKFIMFFCYSFTKGARPYKEVARRAFYPNPMISPYAQPAYGVPVMVSPYQMTAPQPQYQPYQQYQQQPQQTMQYAQYSAAQSTPPAYQSQVPNTQNSS